MSENKKAAVFTSVTVLVLAVVGVGIWFGTKHHAGLTLNDGASSQAASSVTPVSSTSGLNVSSGSATSLGQLGTTSQSGAPTQSGSSSGSSIDPSTFSQYDKYKTNSSALFGDVQVGNGTTLGANQKAFISYKGWLTNGTLFDESKTDSSGKIQALSFVLGQHQVIGGMEEGVAGMKVGGTRLIIVPPGLGYGDQGQGSIPGGAVLVFEVSLLDVQ